MNKFYIIALLLGLIGSIIVGNALGNCVNVIPGTGVPTTIFIQTWLGEMFIFVAGILMYKMWKT